MSDSIDPSPAASPDPLPTPTGGELSPPPLPWEIPEAPLIAPPPDPSVEELRKHWWLPPKPAKGPDPWAHRRGEPRVFALSWTVYILLATLITFGPLAFSLGLDPMSSRHAARMLLVVLASGISILWPAVRLCQSPPSCGGLLGSWQDIVVLFIPLQAALWPMVLVTDWSILTVAAADAFLFAWAWVVGGILGLALGPRVGGSLSADAAPGEARVPRPEFLLAILIFALGVPLAAAFRPIVLEPNTEPDLFVMASPIAGVLELTADRSWSGQTAVVSPEHWWAVLGVFLLGVMLWFLAAGIHAAFPPKSTPGRPKDTTPEPAYPSGESGPMAADH